MTRLCVLLLVPGLVACGRTGPAPEDAARDSAALVAAAPPPAIDPGQPMEIVLTLPAEDRPTLAPRVRALVEAGCAERGWAPVPRIDVEVRCAGGQCTASTRLEPPAPG